MVHTLDSDKMSEDEIHAGCYTVLYSTEHNRTIIGNMIVSRLNMNGAYWFLSRLALFLWLGTLNDQQLAKVRVLLEQWS